jgi:hypothetical protein
LCARRGSPFFNVESGFLLDLDLPLRARRLAMTTAIPLEQTIKDKASIKTLNLLALQLKRGTISGPEDIANATAKALRSVVSTARFTSLEELIQIIRTAGRHLQHSQPRGEPTSLPRLLKDLS